MFTYNSKKEGLFYMKLTNVGESSGTGFLSKAGI